MRWRVVYFDDIPDQIECLQDVLVDQFDIRGTHDVLQFEKYLETNPHLILLDVHMPVMNGYELYAKIQNSPYYNGCPILFISGDVSPENQLKSHQLGASDFLTRDLGIDELAARLINKIQLHQRSALKLSIGNLDLDLEMFCVYIDGAMISLTLNELKILGVILRAYPQICTRDSVMEKIWGDDSVKPSTVNTHMSVLNNKLKDWQYELKFKRDHILVVEKDY